MKQALKAKSIGDKLYQLERIHSKLIHLCRVDGIYGEMNVNNEALIVNTILSLKETLECFNCNRLGKAFMNYSKCVNSLLNSIENSDKDMLFVNFCSLHGAYIKFRRKNKKVIKTSCELTFQNVCMPLFILDFKFGKKKRRGQLRSN